MEDIKEKKKGGGGEGMFLSKSKFGICNRFRIIILPFVVLTSQEASNFEKLCWKNTIQNVSSQPIEAFYFLLRCC